MAKHSDRDARAHRLGMVDAQQGLLNRRHGAVLVILCGDDAQVLLGIRHNVSRAYSMAQSSDTRDVNSQSSDIRIVNSQSGR